MVTTNNPHGRPKGTPNRTTKEMKKLILEIADGEIEHIEGALTTIREDNPRHYLEILVKLFSLVIPRTMITEDEEKVKGNLPEWMKK